MNSSLITDARVKRIARAIDIRRNEVVGSLMVIWEWASRHTHDGMTHHADATFIDEDLAVRQGFASAMQSVGWLVIGEGSLTFPDFDQYNCEWNQDKRRKELEAKASKRYRDKKKAKSESQAAPGTAAPRHDSSCSVMHDASCKNKNENENQEREESPLPPKGGVKSKSGEDSSPPEGEEDPDDDPRADAETAGDVARRYEETVGPNHRGRGEKPVLERLRAGESADRLRRAASAYAADLDATDPPKEARYRQSAKTFYGTDQAAKYPAYRDRPVESTVTPEDCPDLLPAVERLTEAYRTLVRSSHSAAKSGPLILRLLAGGEGEDRLLGAVRRYARRCDDGRLALDARKGAPAFFGGGWLEYAPAPRVPVPPYEPRTALTEEELAARPHLATKTSNVVGYFEELVVGYGDRVHSLLVARILLDGVPPVELLAACEGYAAFVHKEKVERREQLKAHQFFAAEWQRYRATPPSERASRGSAELAKSEEEMERDEQASRERLRQYRSRNAPTRTTE